MRIFATVVKELSKDLVENLMVLSNNFKLSGPYQDIGLSELYREYAEDIQESLNLLGESSDLLRETLLVLKIVFENNKKEDTRTDSMVFSALINKVSQESIELSNKIQVALDNIETELDVMKIVAKTWEFDSPLAEIADQTKFRTIVHALGGIELDNSLADKIRELNRDDLTEAASTLDSRSGCGEFRNEFENLSEKYLEAYNRMDSLSYKIYEEFILAAEKPSEAPNMHMALNRVIGGVRLAEFDDIKTEAINISGLIRKKLNLYIHSYECLRDEFVASDNISALGQVDTLIKEQIGLAGFYIQSLDRLDIMLQRSARAIEENINKLIKVKTSKKELFGEMYSILENNGSQIKKAS